MSDSRKDGGGSSKGSRLSSMFEGLKIPDQLQDAKVHLIHQKSVNSNIRFNFAAADTLKTQDWEAR